MATDKEKDYGLPRLTYAEAARIFGVSRSEMMAFVEEHMEPSDGERSRWILDRRQLPEKLVRLWLLKHMEAEAKREQSKRLDPSSVPKIGNADRSEGSAPKSGHPRSPRKRQGGHVA